MNQEYSFSINRNPFNGKCEKCANETEIYHADISHFNNTKSINLCKACTVALKKEIDEKNKSSNTTGSQNIVNDEQKLHIKKANHNENFSEKTKEFGEVYKGFFTKDYWAGMADKIYTTFNYSYIVEKLIVLLPVVSVVLFLFDIAGLPLGFVNFFAAITLVFYTLKNVTDPLSLAAVIPNTLMAFGTLISGIIMYRYPVILIFGVIVIAQSVFQWLLITNTVKREYAEILLYVSFSELILSVVVMIIGMLTRVGAFGYGIAFTVYFLPQLLQLVLHLPLDESSKRTIIKNILSLRKSIKEKCDSAEKKYEDVFLNNQTESEENSGYFDKENVFDKFTIPEVSETVITEDSTVNYILKDEITNSSNKKEKINDKVSSARDLESILSEDFNMEFLENDF